MAQLSQAFDARNVDPSQTIPSLPVGKHPVVIEASEIKENSKKDGGYLQFDIVIIDGPAKGSKGAYRLNLYHSNPQTVEIAYKQLSALCHVAGVYQLSDSQQLHNIPFIVEVELQKGEEAAKKGYTQVVRVYDRNGNEPGKQAQGQAAAQTQPPAQGGGWGGQPQAPGTQPPAPPAQAPWGGAAAQTPPAQQNPPAGQTPPWGASQQQGGNGGGVAAGPGNAPPWGQR